MSRSHRGHLGFVPPLSQGRQGKRLSKDPPISPGSRTLRLGLFHDFEGFFSLLDLFGLRGQAPSLPKHFDPKNQK